MIEACEIIYYDGDDNFHKVPAKQWSKLTEAQRSKFNAVYSAMTDDPALYWHPKMEPIQKEHWKTIAWNTALIAADL